MEYEKIKRIDEIYPKKIVFLSYEGFTRIPYEIAYSYLEKNSKKKLIWFETDNPSEKIPEIFNEYNLDIKEYIDRIYFIDLISNASGIAEKERENTYYINTPNNMIEISTTLSDILNDEEVGLAIINTLNGLLAFNEEKNLRKFMRVLSKISFSTNTTILINYNLSEFKEIGKSFEICSDVVVEVKGKKIEIKERTSE